MKQKCGIYKITNTINGKAYIGQAQDVEKRWYQHRYYYKIEPQALYKAMRKYGIENFSFEVVEECGIDELDSKEIYYIEKYNTYIHAENSNGYNMTLGGDKGTRGLKLSEETKMKISKANKGRFVGKNNPNYGNHNLKGEKAPFYGRVHTDESKRKMSEAKKGKPLSEEHKEKFSTIRKGEGNAMYGKTHSEKAKQKMSEAKKGKTLPLLESGKKFSQEHIEKLNEAKKKKVECDGIVFDSIKECAEHYGIKYTKMFNWLKGYTKMPKEWQNRNLKYLQEF